jgi:sugar lactone lactonase YvrE
VRVAAGGEVLDVVAIDRRCLSVALGGSDGSSLYICSTEDTDPYTAVNTATSRLEIAEVAIPC